MSLLDRTGAVPLYYQLKQIFLTKIERAEWRAGGMIPSEVELQAEYNVSRTTVRQALSELTFEGRLVRQRGRGTFVAPRGLPQDAHRHLGLSELLRLQGRVAAWRLIDEDWVEASAAVADGLALQEGALVYRIRRLRLVDDEPIGYHTVYLPYQYANEVNHEGLLAQESLQYLRHLPELVHSLASRTLEAKPAGSDEVLWLNVDPGSPILLLERLLVSEEHKPIELLIAAYRGDKFRYQVTG